MKIVCDSCSTKYSISDDKVRGKVFKIRCKKCSHIIVVKGTGEGAAAPPEAANDAVWHLVVDGDQVGPLTDADVRARLARGEISTENYVWKEGFSDWLRLADVPELVEGAAAPAVVGGELFSDSPSGSGRARSPEAAVGEIGEDAGAGAFSSAGSLGQEIRASSRATVDRARAVAASPVDDDAFSLPAAAPRASEGGDLFGMAPMATQADSGRVRSRASNGSSGATLSSRHDGGRVENLTAQRSENSVLFSLSNLQSLAAPSVSTKPSSPQNTEGSGLIDIRAMAASTLKGPSFSAGPSLFGGESKVAADELPTFGAFSSAAPVLFPIPSSSGPPKWLFLLIGVAALLVLVVGFLAFKILSKPMIAETVQIPVPVAVAPPAPAAPASKPIAEGDLPPREKPEAAGADKGSDKADKGGDKGSKGSRHGGSAKGSKKGSGGDAKGEGSGSSSAAAPSAPAEPEKAKPAKGSLDDLLEGALNGRKPRRNDDDAPAAKDKKGGGDSGGGSKGPLEKSAVVAGMNGVKGKVQGCFNQFKVPGMAMVNVVISPSGKVSSATVTGKFAGTPTGSCVEGAVKTASFPPSEGLSTPYPFNLR